MRKLSRFASGGDLEQERALAVFTAGLPDFRRGKVIASSSDPDAWRKKHPAIRARLRAQLAPRARA